MKILIKLQSDNELVCYEAFALAMSMATFDNHVQLWIEPQVFGIIMQTKSRIAGMIKSLPLYELPPVWVTEDEYSIWFTDMLDEEIAKQFVPVAEHLTLDEFDNVLNF